MEFEFLSNFHLRMKKVGAYALLYKNSLQKTTWKTYGLEEFYEQSNVIFAVLLYIMEQSLKDENCTLDDIGSFIDTINMNYFKKPLSYDECKSLGDFVVNTILCDDGKAMYFNGYDFSIGEYKEINISFITNKVVYIDDAVRRTTYYLTDDGYSLLLSTLEIESNMRLTIHEMIFKMHIEKQSYDKAASDVKNIFNILKIQLQKMQDAIRKIKQNALSYSVDEYRKLQEENLESLDNTKTKFTHHRNLINDRIMELEKKDINIKKLDVEDRDKLNYLKVIESYLQKVIDEHQKILLAHFDLKEVYTKELEGMAQMSLIKRFNIKTELYEKVLKDFKALDNIDLFLRPLLRSDIGKTYNINKCVQFQKPIKKKIEEEDGEILSFDEDEWKEEDKAKKREKLKKYNNSLKIILRIVYEKGSTTLREISEIVKKDSLMLNEMIPTVEIFREVIIELLKNKSLNIEELKEEKERSILEENFDFQISESVLAIVEEEMKDIKMVMAVKLIDGEDIKFQGLKSESGTIKMVSCSDIYFEIER